MAIDRDIERQFDTAIEIKIAKDNLSSTLVAVVPAAAQMTCTISADGVNFGAYDVFSSQPTDSTGQIAWECEETRNGVDPTIDLSQGNSGTYTPRQMRQGNESVNYNLYFDAANQQIWGDGSGGTSNFRLPSARGTTTVYGQIPARQNVKVGTYTDSISASCLTNQFCSYRIHLH